jgi:hypothetical protein
MYLVTTRYSYRAHYTLPIKLIQPFQEINGQPYFPERRMLRNLLPGFIIINTFGRTKLFSVVALRSPYPNPNQDSRREITSQSSIIKKKRS